MLRDVKPQIAILGAMEFPINRYLVSELIDSYDIHIIGTKSRLTTKIKQLIKVFKQNGSFGTVYYLIEKYKESFFLNKLVKTQKSVTNTHIQTYLFMENSRELINHFISNQYNFIILGKCGIVSSSVLVAANCKFVNVHPAKLPEYRGYAEPAHAIKDGRIDLIGSTVHWVDEGIDSGSVIDWQPFLKADSKDLSHLLSKVRFDGFVKLVSLIKNTNFTALVGEPQQTRYPLCKMLDWESRKLINKNLKV